MGKGSEAMAYGIVQYYFTAEGPENRRRNRAKPTVIAQSNPE